MPTPFDEFDAEPVEARRWWSDRRFQWVLSALLAAIFLWASFYPGARGSRGMFRFSDPNAIVLAVMPFDLAPGDSASRGRERRLGNRLTATLTELAGDRVSIVDPHITSRFGGSRTPLDTLDRALGATHVLFGSFRPESGRVRVFARLVQVRDGRPLFATRQFARATDTLSTQIPDSIARGVFQALIPRR